jgi:glycosyltransferase involved in cell wall biosynthesis
MAGQRYGSDKMKICYLADVADQSIHGLRWANYFAKKGHEVHIISLGKPNNDIKDITLHILKMWDTKIRAVRWVVNSLSILLQTKKLIKVIKPDILHAHCAYDYGVIGSLSNFHPFVVTAWGSDVLISSKESNITKYTEKFVLKKADLITCGGENLKDAIINFGVRPEKIKLINHGVDTEEFSPQKRDKELREELKALDTPVVLSNRRLSPIYNVESLIKAIPLVLKDFSDTKFVIIGEGPQEDYLKQLAKSIGVCKSVRFTGWLSRNEFIRYVASADIYVSISLSDGASVSIMDAMACKLPVVVTDVGDNRKWIKNGENGFVVPTKDPDSVAKKVVYLIENEDIRKRFGKINRELIEEKANYYKEMGKMEKLYKEIINRG